MIDLAYFAAMYGDDPDPWGFDTRWYEARKFALTMASLPNRRYRRAVEAGCANGALTERLAERCDRLHAFDLYEPALDRARRRLSGHRHVELRLDGLPGGWPDRAGDLVVWSEVAYYLDLDELADALDGAGRWLQVGGDLVAVHYRRPTNYPITADAVHAAIDACGWLAPRCSLDDPWFRLDVWRRR